MTTTAYVERNGLTVGWYRAAHRAQGQLVPDHSRRVTREVPLLPSRGRNEGVTVVGRLDGTVGTDRLVQQVEQAVLGGEGYCVVEHLALDDDNGALLDLCSGLGEVAVDSMVTAGDEMVPVYVQRVEYNPDRMFTGDHYVRTSASNLEFACHTDCASDPSVPDLVFLHCAHAAQSGGESVLVPAARLVEQLDQGTLELLRRPVVPFKYVRAAVLVGEGASLRVRYNRLEIHKAVEQGAELDDDVARALDALDAALEECEGREVVGLQGEDCLVLDNHTVLHGRLPFEQESGRLLFRARAFSTVRGRT